MNGVIKLVYDNLRTLKDEHTKILTKAIIKKRCYSSKKAKEMFGYARNYIII